MVGVGLVALGLCKSFPTQQYEPGLGSIDS
jgi:hypothetical protein